MTADEFDALIFIKGSDPNYRATKAARMILIENITLDVALINLSIPSNDSMWCDRVRTEVARFEAADRCIRDAYRLNVLDQATEESGATVEEVIPVPEPDPKSLPICKPKSAKAMTGPERAAQRIALRNAEGEKKRLKREADLQKSRYAKY